MAKALKSSVKKSIAEEALIDMWGVLKEAIDSLVEVGYEDTAKFLNMQGEKIIKRIWELKK